MRMSSPGPTTIRTGLASRIRSNRVGLSIDRRRGRRRGGGGADRGGDEARRKDERADRGGGGAGEIEVRHFRSPVTAEAEAKADDAFP